MLFAVAASYAAIGAGGRVTAATVAAPIPAVATPARPSRVGRLCAALHAVMDEIDAIDGGRLSVEDEFGDVCNREDRIVRLLGACPAHSWPDARAKALAADRVAGDVLRDNLSAEPRETRLLRTALADVLALTDQRVPA